MKTMPRTLSLSALAEGLTVDNFDREAPKVLRSLDRDDVQIDLSFSRRKASAAARDPYRHDISRIPLMDRAEELRFCMGLELLVLRMQKAKREAGLPEVEVTRLPDAIEQPCLNCVPGTEAQCLTCGAGSGTTLQRARIRRRTQDYVLARNELVERNLYLVFKLLEKYRYVNVAPEDLVQEANLSLFKAVENFDFRRGVLFKTYAGYWINQAFLNAIYNQSRTVRVPAYIQKAMKKLSKVASTLQAGMNDVAAVALEAEVDPDLAATAVQGNRYTTSLNRRVDGTDATEFVDLLEAPAADPLLDGEEPEQMRQHLFEAVAQLTQREQAVLQMRYGLGGQAITTLAEVGRILGISLERVRQIQAGALEKIRKGFAGPSLQQFA
jgi:RNA polymerase sigma factor (sigma-70 family)